MHGRIVLRFLVVGAFIALGSGCSLSAPDSSQSKITIRMAGASPVEKLFAPFTQGLMSGSTTADFTCLAVNVMGFGIPPAPKTCSGCSGSNCNCGQDEVDHYNHLPDNIAGRTFCGYAGVTTPPITNDANPKSVKLTVPSGPKRIVEIVGIVDPALEVCNSGLPLGHDNSNDSDPNKPLYFEVGRQVVDLFFSKSVSIPDTWTDLSTDPAAQALREIGGDTCKSSGSTPSSYYGYIQTESSMVVYWPFSENTGTTAGFNGSSGSSFGQMIGSSGAAQNGTGSGPLNQSQDAAVNSSMILPATSHAGNTMTGSVTFGKVSVEAWVKIPVASSCGTFAKIFELGTVPIIKLHCFGSGTAGFQVFDGTGSAFISSDSGFPIIDGNWHHLVGTWDQSAGGTPKLYIDGVDRSVSGSSGTVANMMFTSLPFTVSEAGANPLPTNTRVSNIALYNDVLSASAVLKHYHASGR